MLKKLSLTLQNSPIIITAMFLLTLISGITGLILGWKQLYTDYLSKTFNTPVWLAIFIVLILLIAATFLRAPNKRTAPTELKIIEGKEFGVQRVNLDGFHFKRCKFDRTELIFSGRLGFGLSDITLSNFTMTVDNEAATTLNMLTELYQNESFRPIIEETISNIKSGHTPRAPTVTNL